MQMLDIWQAFITHLKTRTDLFANHVDGLVFLTKTFLKRRCSEFLKIIIIFTERFKEQQIK